MSRWLPLTVLLLSAGCGNDGLAKPTPNSDAAPSDLVARQSADAPVKDPPPTPEFPPRMRMEMKTPQGLVVEMPIQHDPWADRVVSFKPGSPAPKESTNAWSTMGKPDYNTPPPSGRNATHLSLGHGGELVVEFVDNVLIDGDGDDLVIFEVGQRIEPTKIFISEEGKKWIAAGEATGAKSTLDIAKHAKPAQKFRFVKLLDSKAALSNKGTHAGADIDAVGAINSLPIADAPSRAAITAQWIAKRKS